MVENCSVSGDLTVDGEIKGIDSVRVYRNSSKSISSGSWTAIDFNAERWDTNALHDNSTNNSRLTCKTAGKYLVIGSVLWDHSASGGRHAFIRKNGSSIEIQTTGKAIDPSGHETAVNLSIIVDLAVNDYVEFFVYQNSGANLNIKYVSPNSPEFMMARVG